MNSFKSLPRNVRDRAIRELWPNAWEDDTPLTPEQHIELEAKQEAFAEHYYAQVAFVRAHRARMAEQAACGRFSSKSLTERRAILDYLRRRKVGAVVGVVPVVWAVN